MLNLNTVLLMELSVSNIRTGKEIERKGDKGDTFLTKYTHTYKLFSDYRVKLFFSPHEPVFKVMLLPSGHLLNSSSQFNRQYLNLMISKT